MGMIAGDLTSISYNSVIAPDTYSLGENQMLGICCCPQEHLKMSWPFRRSRHGPVLSTKNQCFIHLAATEYQSPIEIVMQGSKNLIRLEVGEPENSPRLVIKRTW